MKRLVIGPGAMAYFAYLGALGALRDVDKLNNLEEISGASAGGLLAFFYVISDGNIKTILDYSTEIPLKNIMKPNIRLFLKDFGLISHKKIRDVITNIINVFFGKNDVTFAELREFRPHMPDLYISALCVDLNKTEYFSSSLTPSMSVTDALCMTIAVPFLFASVPWNGRRYIDGGTLEETPAGVFLGKNDVTLLRSVWENSSLYNTKNLKTYVTAIFSTTMCLRHRYTYPSILIDMTQVEIFDFNMATEAKLKLFSFGYHTTLKQVLKP